MDNLTKKTENSTLFSKNKCVKTIYNSPRHISGWSNNIVHMLSNRETFGNTSRKFNDSKRKMLGKTSPMLRLPLMDIVPESYLGKHVFMGFSQCGQFLLSFTRVFNTENFFRRGLKFTLHFLLWVPGKLVRPVHSVPLFNDERVEGEVKISMTQWKHNPGVLVVYGIADSSSEMSYLSVIGVPRLGCKKCSAYAKEEVDYDMRWGNRCLEHNFGIHTKFVCTFASSTNEPAVQLAYSNQIVINVDSIHILEIDFEKPDPEYIETNGKNKFTIDSGKANSMDINRSTLASNVSAPFQSLNYQNNVLRNILAVFSTESAVLRAHDQIESPPSPAEPVALNSSSLSILEAVGNSESEYRAMEMLYRGSSQTAPVHYNTLKTLSDVAVSPQDPYLVHSENSKCSKSFTRYFVQSDVEITSETDCMFGCVCDMPLHLTGYGARYTPLQGMGAGAWKRLPSSARACTIRATLRTLDTDLLCNEVCARLCHLRGMKFIYCFDWGCHLIDVCPSSRCLSGSCAMSLWASEEAAAACGNCKSISAGCLRHRKQYTAECLFVWDLETGVYRTEMDTMTEDDSKRASKVSGDKRARELAKRLAPINRLLGNDIRLLTPFTGSVKTLTDVDNGIEIIKNRPNSYDSDSDSQEEDSDYEL